MSPLNWSTKAFTTLLLIIVGFNSVKALDCFKCVSMGGSNKACDDPFHNNYTSEIFESPCMGGRKGRDGLFPATACLKLSGVFDNGQTMMVRGCALDSGSLTVDTEIVRMSHCGGFDYNGQYVSGCVQSCFEDGCNGTGQISPLSRVQYLILLLIAALVHCPYFYFDT